MILHEFRFLIDGQVRDDLLELGSVPGAYHQNIVGVDDEIVLHTFYHYQFVFLAGDDDTAGCGVYQAVVAFDDIAVGVLFCMEFKSFLRSYA